MFEDYTERLFAHYVGGRWRAPFGAANVPVPVAGGTAAGYVVSAGSRDVARAITFCCGADGVALDRLQNTFSRATSDLVQARVKQLGLSPHAASHALVSDMATAASAPQGSILLSTPDTGLPVLLKTLGSRMQAGVIWCPPPQQAILATLIAQLVQASDVPAGAFALLHTRVAETEAALRATGLPLTLI